MDRLEELLNSQKNKKLLAVFAHPDDETMAAGGLLLLAKELGYEVTVLILTQGGAGQLHIHPKGKTTKQVRKMELEKATKILGADSLILFDFDDGKLREQIDGWKKLVKNTIEEVNPSIVVSFDHSGWTGHPDHIISSVETKNILRNYPDTILLWPVIDPEGKKWVNEEVRDIMPKANYYFELGKKRRLALYKAASSYPSQRFSDKKLMPILRIILGWKCEWYHKVNLKKKYEHRFVKFDI
jgi:LmbE family N-acetylglucosaminyl deacetylase